VGENIRTASMKCFNKLYRAGAPNELAGFFSVAVPLANGLEASPVRGAVPVADAGLVDGLKYEMKSVSLMKF
jgi:hypothetical protein